MRIGIGIDTGGTYTDAVAFDYDEKKVLAKGKSPTTHENLSIGISGALDNIPEELIKNAVIVSLSTTLSTNACIEDKGCRSKLIMIGMTDELIRRFDGKKYGIDYDMVRCIDNHSSADGLEIDEPDWNQIACDFGDFISDAAVLSTAELFSVFNGAPCEKKLRDMIAEKFGKECICAGDITSELNVIQRGATALLNGRLLPVIHEFIGAIKADFARRGCTAPIMVVRSDGSLMSAGFSASRPVETISSGPAASALAGRTATKSDNYVIIDMGGTTTDISVVKDGKPVMAKEGLRVAKWHTSISGLNVTPFALGGDTCIRLSGGKLTLDKRRAVPMCVAAVKWPEIKDRLRTLIKNRHVNMFPLHEGFYLMHEPTAGFSEREMRIADAVKDGPRLIGELPSYQIDLYHLETERLESEEVLMRFALTPTDFMHIKGDFNTFDREASELAAKFVLMNRGIENPTEDDILELADEAYRLVSGRLYRNITEVLLADRYPSRFEDGIDPLTREMIDDSWNELGDDDVTLRRSYSTKMELIGVGAPIHIFLPAAAKALGASYVLPEHAEVANAIGALNAGINVSFTIEISQRLSSDGNLFYIAHMPEGAKSFDDYDKAVSAAKVSAENAVREEAKRRGASSAVTVSVCENQNEAITGWGSKVKLGSTVTAEAAMWIE